MKGRCPAPRSIACTAEFAGRATIALGLVSDESNHPPEPFAEATGDRGRPVVLLRQQPIPADLTWSAADVRAVPFQRWWLFTILVEHPTGEVPRLLT